MAALSCLAKRVINAFAALLSSIQMFIDQDCSRTGHGKEVGGQLTVNFGVKVNSVDAEEKFCAFARVTLVSCSDLEEASSSISVCICEVKIAEVAVGILLRRGVTNSLGCLNIRAI